MVLLLPTGFLSLKIWILLCLAWAAITLLKSILLFDVASSNGWHVSTWTDSSMDKFRSGMANGPMLLLRPNDEDATCNVGLLEDDAHWNWTSPKLLWLWWLGICIICSFIFSSFSAVKFEELTEPWIGWLITKLRFLYSTLGPLILSCKNSKFHKSKN